MGMPGPQKINGYGVDFKDESLSSPDKPSRSRTIAGNTARTASSTSGCSRVA